MNYEYSDIVIIFIIQPVHVMFLNHFSEIMLYFNELLIFCCFLAHKQFSVLKIWHPKCCLSFGTSTNYYFLICINTPIRKSILWENIVFDSQFAPYFPQETECNISYALLVLK